VKKIRVLHITFDMTIGGAQQVIRQLVENMDQDQFAMDIVCIDGRLGELGEILIAQGFKVHLFERESGFNFKLVRQLRNLIRQNSYDIVHCHQYTPYVYGLLAALSATAKVIFTEHGRFYPDYGTWKRKLINPIFSLFTSKITAISKATKDALVQYENFGQSKIEVIYNGIADMSQIEVNKIELKKQLGIPESAFLFGTISRLQPIKNQAMMIRAFKVVYNQYKNTHLLIVGDGQIRGQLEKQVGDLKLDKQVTFAGFQNDPYQFHKVIDVFLLTSFSEGASMTLLEAMSLSKPCVVTNVGGNPELIIDGVNGFVTPSKVDREFADACMKLCAHQTLRRAMGSEGRELYKNLFSIGKMIDSFVKLYR
jgi:glycosyltransferase involved in cell wall biosynthesis